MDAATAIKNDHQILKELFTQLRDGTGDRYTLIAEIRARITAHNYAEETTLYPTLTNTTAHQPDEVSYEIHTQVREGIDGLRRIEEKLDELQAATDDQFEVALARLSNAVDVHAEEEENVLLPFLERTVPDEYLEELGTIFQQRRDQALHSAALEELAAQAESPSAFPPDELERER